MRNVIRFAAPFGPAHACSERWRTESPSRAQRVLAAAALFPEAEEVPRVARQEAAIAAAPAPSPLSRTSVVPLHSSTHSLPAPDPADFVSSPSPSRSTRPLQHLPGTRCPVTLSCSPPAPSAQPPPWLGRTPASSSSAPRSAASSRTLPTTPVRAPLPSSHSTRRSAVCCHWFTVPSQLSRLPSRLQLHSACGLS